MRVVSSEADRARPRTRICFVSRRPCGWVHLEHLPVIVHQTDPRVPRLVIVVHRHDQPRADILDVDTTTGITGQGNGTHRTALERHNAQVRDDRVAHDLTREVRPAVRVDHITEEVDLILIRRVHRVKVICCLRVGAVRRDGHEGRWRPVVILDKADAAIMGVQCSNGYGRAHIELLDVTSVQLRRAERVQGVTILALDKVQPIVEDHSLTIRVIDRPLVRAVLCHRPDDVRRPIIASILPPDDIELTIARIKVDDLVRACVEDGCVVSTILVDAMHMVGAVLLLRGCLRLYEVDAPVSLGKAGWRPQAVLRRLRQRADELDVRLALLDPADAPQLLRHEVTVARAAGYDKDGQRYRQCGG